MPDYDPFERGPHPVGTRSFSWTDTNRDDRTLPVDVWYPATNAFQGKDFDPDAMDRYEMVPGMGETAQNAVADADAEPGRYPLVVFSHGFGGERRQSTFFYTHLASHGYVVAAMDHVGNTTVDMISGAAAAGDDTVIDKFIELRPGDVSFTIDRLQAGDAGFEFDTTDVGLAGHSFGGWTTLKTVGTDTRICAALPLAPAGGNSPEDPPEGNPMATSLDFNWGKQVPTLYIVADLDSILPIEGMRDLHRRTPDPRTSVVLQNADHFHFNDDVEQTQDGFRVMMQMMMENADEIARKGLEASLAKMKPSTELCPGEHAYQLISGLGLAHFDSHLRGNADAAAMLAGDLVSLMAARGVAVELIT